MRKEIAMIGIEMRPRISKIISVGFVRLKELNKHVFISEHIIFIMRMNFL